MSWFFEFLSVLFSSLGKNDKVTLSGSVSEAYTIALSPHHSFLLRQASKLAIAAVPDRKSFEDKLFPDLTSEKLCDKLRDMAGKIDKVRGVIGKFFTENKLTELS